MYQYFLIGIWEENFRQDKEARWWNSFVRWIFNYIQNECRFNVLCYWKPRGKWITFNKVSSHSFVRLYRYRNLKLYFSVLNCFYDSTSLILRKNVEKRALFRHLENIFLALDEICDQGIVMEIDPQAVFDRLAIRGEDIPLSEQNITQLYQQAKEQVKWSLFK